MENNTRNTEDAFKQSGGSPPPSKSNGRDTEGGLSMLSAALANLSHGFRVFPITPLKKTPPRIKDFPNAAFTTEEQVGDWWGKHPDDNVGIACGLTTDGRFLLVLDVDRKHGVDGGVALAALEAKYSPLPRTRMVGTPTGGDHRYFYVKDAAVAEALKNSVGKLGDGLDIRIAGGYVVAAGSFRDDEEATGHWVVVQDSPIAEAPEWLLEELKRVGTSRKSIKGGGSPNSATLKEPIPEGKRNNTLASIAGTLRARGADEKLTYATISILNNMVCKPPLEDEEVRGIAESINRYEAGQPVLWPEDLSGAALQGVVGEFVQTTMPHTEADVNCLVVQVLPVLGAVLGHSGKDIHATFGADQHYPSLFTLTLGNTNSGKGQGFAAVRSLMKQVDPNWVKKHWHQHAASGEALVRLAAEAEGQSGLTEEEDDDEPDVGIIGGAKPGTVGVRYDNGGRLLLTSPEMSVLLNASNREGSNLSGYLRSAYDRFPLTNHRSKKAVTAYNYVLGVIGHIVPQELSGILHNVDWYNGLVNRFVWSAVKKSKSLPRINQVPDYGAIAQTLRGLAGLPLGGRVEFTESGGRVWDDWVRELPDDDGKLGASQQRIRPNALRLALIYAMLDPGRLRSKTGKVELAEQHVLGAIEIANRSRKTVQWFLSMPWKRAEKLGGHGADDVEKFGQAITAKGGRMTGKELAGLFSHKNAEQRKAIATAAGAKLTVQKPDGRGNEGEVWEL